MKRAFTFRALVFSLSFSFEPYEYNKWLVYLRITHTNNSNFLSLKLHVFYTLWSCIWLVTELHAFESHVLSTHRSNTVTTWTTSNRATRKREKGKNKGALQNVARQRFFHISFETKSSCQNNVSIPRRGHAKAFKNLGEKATNVFNYRRFGQEDLAYI